LQLIVFYRSELEFQGNEGDVMSWVDSGFIAFDTETTGVDVGIDRIVSAAAIEFRDGIEVSSQEWLIKVDVEIPPGASAVHGITNEMSQSQGLDQVEALASIREFLASRNLPVVCFNSQFDRSILDSNLERVGREPLSGIFDICPYVIDKQMDKFVKGKAQRRLQPTVARYGLELNEADWHGALADARITGALLLAQQVRYPNLFTDQPDELAESVSLWREDQDASFKAWLAKQPPLPS
jgi:DNA polymerase-3 subunit epsilon